MLPGCTTGLAVRLRRNCITTPNKEPSPGIHERESAERVTEWQSQRLPDSKKAPDSIARFLAVHASARMQA